MAQLPVAIRLVRGMNIAPEKALRRSFELGALEEDVWPALDALRLAALGRYS